jgi:CelD/BcsL family acetyltransferase involved in cellulose biosynthesis
MINISPLPELSVLEERWRQLAATTPHSFFLSWPWISTWLFCIPSSVKPLLLTVSSDDHLLAIALIVKRTIWRRNVMPVKTWVLNATGDRRFDSICTEHNGLLASSHDEQAAWDEILDYFSAQEKDWDEFHLDGVPRWLADAWSTRGLALRRSRLDVGRFLDLDRVRATANRSCIGILAPRVRTRLRHTIGAVERRFGALEVSEASTIEDARSFFSELKDLHIKRWGDQPHGDAFDRPFFERFHHELISRCFADGLIQLARVKAGQTTLGLLYNFVYQGRVSFYQSGINYASALPGDSIGLLVHALVIDRNAHQGQAIYDMLAGDAQYKRSLAGLTTPLWWGALQTSCMKLRAERFVIHNYLMLRERVRKMLR